MSPLRFNEAFGRLLKGVGVGQLKQPPQVQRWLTAKRDQPSLLLPLLREEWEIPASSISTSILASSRRVRQAYLRAANGDPLVLLVRRERGNIFLQLFGCEWNRARCREVPPSCRWCNKSLRT